MKKKKVSEKKSLESKPASIVIEGIQCPECQEIVISLHRHDFRFCGCGSTFVDGGRDYIRCGGKNIADIKHVKIRISDNSIL